MIDFGSLPHMRFFIENWNHCWTPSRYATVFGVYETKGEKRAMQPFLKKIIFPKHAPKSLFHKFQIDNSQTQIKIRGPKASFSDLLWFLSWELSLRRFVGHDLVLRRTHVSGAANLTKACHRKVGPPLRRKHSTGLICDSASIQYWHI